MRHIQFYESSPLTFPFKCLILPLMALITPATARENAAKAHAARRANQALARIAAEQPEAQRIEPQPQPQFADTFTEDIVHAQNETLTKLREATEPRDRACLARALRDLRETYHLVTGEARPGIKKGDGQRRRTTGPSPDPTPAPDHNEPTPAT